MRVFHALFLPYLPVPFLHINLLHPTKPIRRKMKLAREYLQIKSHENGSNILIPINLAPRHWSIQINTRNVAQRCFSISGGWRLPFQGYCKSTPCFCLLFTGHIQGAETLKGLGFHTLNDRPSLMWMKGGMFSSAASKQLGQCINFITWRLLVIALSTALSRQSDLSLCWTNL